MIWYIVWQFYLENYSNGLSGENNMELVSIIIRTCGRPHILKGALESVRNQTYKNIEVVVAEDGENTAKKMLEAEFADLNIKYANTGERKGRTVVGNLALSMATGQYFNFLDDDDLLLSKHIETLLNAIQQSEKMAAYSIAYESIVRYDSKAMCYREYKKWIRYRQPFNRTLLTFNNYIPIQSIMFSRELYDELGGFDETMDVLEDWELWVKYSTKTDFEFVDKITSLYRVPKKKNKRNTDFHLAYLAEIEKFKKYHVSMNYYDVNREVEYMLNYLKTPRWKRNLKKLRDKMLFHKR